MAALNPILLLLPLMLYASPIRADDGTTVLAVTRSRPGVGTEQIALVFGPAESDPALLSLNSEELLEPADRAGFLGEAAAAPEARRALLVRWAELRDRLRVPDWSRDAAGRPLLPPPSVSPHVARLTLNGAAVPDTRAPEAQAWLRSLVRAARSADGATGWTLTRGARCDSPPGACASGPWGRVRPPRP